MSAQAYTVWPDVKAGSKSERLSSWAEFCARIQALPPGPKNEAELIKLATFGDLRTAKGSLRHDPNVLTVTGIEGDYDGEEVSPHEALARLERHHIRAMVVTTHSHTPEAPRWREVQASWLASWWPGRHQRRDTDLSVIPRSTGRAWLHSIGAYPRTPKRTGYASANKTYREPPDRS